MTKLYAIVKGKTVYINPEIHDKTVIHIAEIKLYV